MNKRGSNEVIPEVYELSIASDSDPNQQNPEPSSNSDRDGKLNLKYFDLPCITKDSKSTSHRIYLGSKTSNFVFQFSYLEFRGLRTLEKIDEKLLLGDVLSLLKVAEKFLQDTNIDKPHERSLLNMKSHQTKESLTAFALPLDMKKIRQTEPFVLDHFLPNDENFLESDYKQLEEFLLKNSGPQFYAKGLIERGRGNVTSAFACWMMGARNEKCLPSLCMALRLPEQLGQGPDIEAIVDFIVDVSISSGIYYSTQIDRHSSHPSLVYNIAVMMDCSPVLRNAVISRLEPLANVFEKESVDLFDLERLVAEEESWLEVIILYLVCELNRMDKRFYLALTFLEYYVQIAGESCKYGLILADILDMVNEKDIASKLMQYYVKAYKSDDSFVSTTALARLSIIYHRNFNKAMEDNPQDYALHKELYEHLCQTHRFLAKVNRIESMRFLLSHYLRCLCFVCNEKKPITSYHREIENLLMNRKMSLELSLTYFDYFCTMGERGDILLCHFEVMRYLKYREASYIGMRYASLNMHALSYSKRYFLTAICKKDGIDGEPDYFFAFRVFKSYFAELISQMSYANAFEISLCLSYIADLTEKCEQPLIYDQTQTCDKPKIYDLRYYALLFALHSDECQKLTKKFLYNLTIMLRNLEYYPIPWEKQKENVTSSQTPDDNTEQDAAAILSSSFFTPYTTNDDHVYHYCLEHASAVHLHRYDTLADVRRRLADDGMQRSALLRQLTRVRPDDGNSVESLMVCLDKLKSRITEGNKIQLTMEYINEKVSPKVDECNTYFEKTFSTALPNQESGVKNQPSMRRVSKKLTVLDSLEREAAELEKPLQKMIEGDLKQLGKVMKINILEQSAVSMIGKYKNVRVVRDSELSMDEERPMHKFSNRVYVFNAMFTANQQACKVFRIEVNDQARLNSFVENILWMTGTSPFILNYYGIRFKPGQEGLSVDIVAEDFEGFALSNDGTKIWTTQSVSLQAKLQLFEDLLMAVRSLHFIGKPHLTLTASHMVVCKSSTRLKVIVPFFAEYFNDPSLFMKSVSMPDMAYVSPRILQASTFPQQDVHVFADNITNATVAFLNSDIWTIGVVLVEILSGYSFGVGEHVGNYKMAIRKKSKVDEIVEFELKRLKKKHPGKKIPIYDLTAYFLNNHLERPSIYRTIRFLTDFIKREFGVDLSLETKQDKDYFLRSCFDSIDFFKADDAEQLPLRGNELVKLYLPANLEYSGFIDRDYLPKGRGVVKRGRHTLVEATFEGGVPAGDITMHGQRGNSIQATVVRGGVAACGFKTTDGDTRNLSEALHAGGLMPSAEHVLVKFLEAFKDDSTYQDMLADFRKDGLTMSDTEKAANALDNLAETLAGRMREDQLKANSDRQMSKNMKEQLKSLGVSEYSSDDERKQQQLTEGKDAHQKPKERLQKFDFVKIEKWIENLLILRDILVDKREKTKKPHEDEETFASKSKKPVEVSDPFGYIYDIQYNSHTDHMFYSRGKTV